MSSFAADEGHFVADARVAVLESNLLLSAILESHLLLSAVLESHLLLCAVQVQTLL